MHGFMKSAALCYHGNGLLLFLPSLGKEMPWFHWFRKLTRTCVSLAQNKTKTKTNKKKQKNEKKTLVCKPGFYVSSGQ